MRVLVLVLACALAACSPPAASTSGVETTATAAPSFTIDPVALGGQWSFDRTCGLYDLVFMNDHTVSYYDYADSSHVISYSGAWALADRRVTLSVRRLDANGAPSGDPLTYTLDITAPVTTDLVGRFGPEGGAAQAINAKQCAFEDRE